MKAFYNLKLLRNYEDKRLTYDSRKMFVQYGEWKYYPENEWEELVSFGIVKVQKKIVYLGFIRSS